MIRILIDPGHGGSETGAVSKGIIEKDLNLKGSLLLRDLLKSKGYEVFLTREADVYMSLDARGQMAKDLKVNLILSFHFNAFNTAARGFECIHSYNNESAQWVAQCIAEEMKKAGFALREKPVYTTESVAYPGRNWFGVLRNSEPIAGIITEALFIDNSLDVAVLNQSDFWTKLINAYAKGIGVAYGIESVTASTTPAEQTQPAVIPVDSTDYKKISTDLKASNAVLANQLIEIANKLKG